MLADLKYAWRQLRKSPGFAVTAVLTLALGIGATTAIFTLFDQVMLRVLPVAQPRELVRMDWHGSFSGSMSDFCGDVGNYFSYPMYKDLRDRNQAFSGMLATMKTNVGVVWCDQAEDEDTEVVSGDYFQVLGLRPFAGRLFTSSDETATNGNAVVVLSYDYWRTHFGVERDVIGQTLAINGHPFTIVGIAPEVFHTAIGGYRPGVFIPVTMVEQAMRWTVPGRRLDNHLNLWLTIVARLKPGVTPAQAQASLLPLWRALRAQELTLYPSASRTFKERYVAKSTIQVLDDSRGFSPNRLDLETPLIILLSMAELLPRSVGRPSHKPIVWYKGFLYRAASWTTARRVVAKVEHHAGELFPRIGFIVTNLETPSRAVVRFYNKRGTAEQWIKEGKQAVKMTRLSCHRFRSNEVRLWLSVIAYNLGNLWRRLVLPKGIET
jgi:hypothetical protein